jgi:hypothetical protein
MEAPRAAGAPAERARRASTAPSFIPATLTVGGKRAPEARFLTVSASMSATQRRQRITIADAMNLRHAEVQCLCGFLMSQIQEVHILSA